MLFVDRLLKVIIRKNQNALVWAFGIVSLFHIPVRNVQAQSVHSLSGTVMSENHIPLEGITLTLTTSTSKKFTQTNASGVFSFANLASGSYELQASHLNYLAFTQTVTVPATALTITLTENIQQLDDVVITGKSETQEVKEQMIRAVVVDTKVAEVQPATLTELMNRTAGVRIRQSGGLGSSSEVSINGFQGRAVRYFKDGIPLDYLGDGYSIATVPLNALERVEIYKGVLPVSLGADALGGAVNMVSKKTTGVAADASYEIASFNTHRLSARGSYAPKDDRWFVGAEAFYNYSDNDYIANVRLGNNVSKDLRMFHNGFESYYAEAFAGVQNSAWADELRISLAVYAIEREQQHPAMMTFPYGKIMGKQRSVIPTLRYKKSAFNKKLHFDQFLVLNTIVRNRIDTAGGSYDWYGNFTRVSGRVGESSQPANSTVNFHHFISRSNIRYHVNDNNELELNVVHMQVKRVGSDPLGPRFLNTTIDVLSVPAYYEKQVVSAGWTLRLFSERLTNNIIGKYYRFGSRGTDAWDAAGANLEDEIVHTGNSFGIGDAIKFQLNDVSSVRVSVEYANRLPEQDELFGNGIWVVPNFKLKPETSLNVNAGYRLAKENLTLETNGFYRKTKKLILLIPTQPPFAHYVNLDNVNGYGLETDVMLHNLFRFFTLSGNFTWQSLRMADIDRPQEKWKNETRLRNTPYFFANLGLSGNFPKVFFQHDQLKPYIHYNFVREFYMDNIPREMEPDGFLGLFGTAGINKLNLVPNQHLISAGFTYQPLGRHYTFGFEIKNITDSDLYDYYRIQRAGRSFHLKISYQL